MKLTEAQELQIIQSKPPHTYWNGHPRPTLEEDIRNIERRDMDGPRPNTCLLLPLTYESIPMTPTPPMKW